ncbi:hypothetical protein BD289DRAFT_483248 [Coniella lustricola]|uniref:Uncharacterized protein n=1 Tax=Coniella lustricola TaxID=2025994 RepID=A0A2T3A643_9PEZI|nr:hypothetical protein BD289DRAFT_483248 [Coniella lustricola]
MGHNIETTASTTPSSSSSRHTSSDSETVRSWSSANTNTTSNAKRRAAGRKHSSTSSHRSSTACGSNSANRTTYALAYPAPVFIDKASVLKHLRPRLYVQLQQKSADGRHFEPYIDVISLAPPRDPRRLVSVVTKRLKRLQKKKTEKTVNKKGMHIDKHDVLIVRTDDDIDRRPTAKAPVDNTTCSASGNDIGNQIGDSSSSLDKMMPGLEDLTPHKVLAVLRANTNTFLTQDGRSWTGSKRPNGSFEFLHVDQYGLEHIARWVMPGRRASISSPPLGSITPTMTTASTLTAKTTSPAAATAVAAGLTKSESSFNFSVIDPSVRRHAVLATLDSSCLHIKNTFVDPVTAVPKSPNLGGEVKIVDEATRILILASSVWLGLHLGWSPSYQASATC